MADAPPNNRVFICLGSNVDAESNLPAAVRMLGRFGVVVAASTVYETLPVGATDQPHYLNAAVLFETDRSVREVFGVVVPAIEQALGRVRDPADRCGARTIDLDVALFNDLVTKADRHELPDPDITRYPFVAIPLAELEPDYVHPVIGRTLAEIAADFQIPAGDMRPRPDVRLIA